jgi:hypothetical protein
VSDLKVSEIETLEALNRDSIDSVQGCDIDIWARQGGA